MLTATGNRTKIIWNIEPDYDFILIEFRAPNEILTIESGEFIEWYKDCYGKEPNMWRVDPPEIIKFLKDQRNIMAEMPEEDFPPGKPGR